MSFAKKIFTRVSTNWRSGLTVALVSIPLSVSLAVASQSTPTAGIITAIWAGLIASIFGGSKFNIVGPTGALSGILAAEAITHGAGILPMLAIMSGIIILVAYATKLERFLIFVPGSTIHGFTLGVAIIIAANQANFALGLSGLKKHEHFIQNIWETILHATQLSPTALIFCLITLTLLFVFLKYTPKIPGAIILSPLGILLGYLISKEVIPLQLQTLGEKFPDITPTIFQLPTFTWNPALITAAITIAIVAILETMISAKIADGMTGTKHNKRKEMFALGLANIGSGFAGGIPATAALARTSLNIKTGASDNVSAAISSITVAAISLLLITSFQYIPLAFIAAILIFVAIRMIEREHFIRMWRADKIEFGIAIGVAITTIMFDPIIGILVGTAVALLVFVERISRGQFEATSETGQHINNEEPDIKIIGDTTVYSIKGPLVYINATAHITRLESLAESCKNIIIRLREVSFIDSDGVEAFDEMLQILQEKHKHIYISGVTTQLNATLKESMRYKRIEDEHHIFNKTIEALSAIK